MTYMNVSVPENSFADRLLDGNGYGIQGMSIYDVFHC